MAYFGYPLIKNRLCSSTLFQGTSFPLDAIFVSPLFPSSLKKETTTFESVSCVPPPLSFPWLLLSSQRLVSHNARRLRARTNRATLFPPPLIIIIAALSLAGCISKNTVPFFIHMPMWCLPLFFCSAGALLASLSHSCQNRSKKQNLARGRIFGHAMKSIFRVIHKRHHKERVYIRQLASNVPHSEQGKTCARISPRNRKAFYCLTLFPNVLT